MLYNPNLDSTRTQTIEKPTMFKKTLKPLALVCVVFTLMGCGNKGELYLPVSDCDKGKGELCEQQEN
jgi:predicted small lipoprotein YifL